MKTFSCPACRGEFQIAEASQSGLYVCPHCEQQVAAGGPPPARAGAGPPERECPDCRTRYAGIRCPECNAGRHVARARAEARMAGGAFGPERAAFRAGVWGGVAMILVAAVWFFLGWKAGRIFFYPPVLAFLGVAAIVNDVIGGGSRRRRRAGRAGASRTGRRAR